MSMWRINYLKIVKNALKFVIEKTFRRVPLHIIEININAKAQGLIGVDLFNG